MRLRVLGLLVASLASACAPVGVAPGLGLGAAESPQAEAAERLLAWDPLAVAAPEAWALRLKPAERRALGGHIERWRFADAEAAQAAEAALAQASGLVAEAGLVDASQGEDWAGRDGVGHGTHVAGLVAAATPGDQGPWGGAPEAEVLPIKVAAAGNVGGAVLYPAAHAGVVAVGALTQAQSVPSYSAQGAHVCLVAPGGALAGQGPGVLSTLPTYRLAGLSGTHLGELSGTSMAAPQVSAAVALLLTREPGLNAPQVRLRLAASAADLGAPGWDAHHGFGRLDVPRLLGLGGHQGVE